jgi:hypothetical protein
MWSLADRGFPIREGHFIYFSLRLLLTTLTLLNAMAAPAIIGLRRNPVKG